MDFNSFYKLSYGLYIVSAAYGGKKNGFIANTAFQVTAEPAQVAISCSKNNYTAQLIENSKLFSISVLHQNATRELFGTFGYKTGKDFDKFADVKYFENEQGIPVVTQDTIAWFQCKVVQTVDVGTHLLFIAEVTDCELTGDETEEITYNFYRNIKKGVAPKNAPTFQIKNEENKMKEEKKSAAMYECKICGHIYDPETEGGVAFEDLPEDWICPICGVAKDMFEMK